VRSLDITMCQIMSQSQAKSPLRKRPPPPRPLASIILLSGSSSSSRSSSTSSKRERKSNVNEYSISRHEPNRVRVLSRSPPVPPRAKHPSSVFGDLFQLLVLLFQIILQIAGKVARRLLNVLDLVRPSNLMAYHPQRERRL